MEWFWGPYFLGGKVTVIGFGAVLGGSGSGFGNQSPSKQRLHILSTRFIAGILNDEALSCSISRTNASISCRRGSFLVR